VFTEDHREVAPGSGEKGFIARTGPIPVGYYKDEAKTAKTFPTINGVRYSIPGDWCIVEADGTLTLLGRGSACINSAGEKIYPEEVEEALKTHPAVVDALVVGRKHPVLGNEVCAVVAVRPGASVSLDDLREHAGGLLARYKLPRDLRVAEHVQRSPAGKPDYAWARSLLA
jgi:acyl-CoA synthetase (AMP-forming)/AMP-acid ligase II